MERAKTNRMRGRKRTIAADFCTVAGYRLTDTVVSVMTANAVSPVSNIFSRYGTQV
jgi:hypothetical protein